MNKTILFFNTIRFLKARQIYYRVFYFLRKRVRRLSRFTYPSTKVSNPTTLTLNDSISNYPSYLGMNKFKFLNIEHDFEKNINWNHSEYGKLWTYNLNYFEYLNQNNSYDYIELIENFIDETEKIIVGYESFPIALRGINWIKYLTYNNIENQKINDSLYAQYSRLKDNLEYHLLGNHLLENAFSLLFAAYYFQDQILYVKAKKILLDELEEQILDDGAHFELSPMYHQIMLFRLLDVINLVKNNHWKNDELLTFLNQRAEIMLGWLENITYNNGDIPLLNDSTNEIAPKSEDIFKYAQSLNISMKRLNLNASGYRKVIKANYESIVDVGEIGADYIPGHAHSDTFNFEVYRNNKPFIVDTGLSTYETNERRMIERSTSSHNTVEVLGLNQTQVWGGFRVAKRANIIFLEEKNNYLKAKHNGYKAHNIVHERVWKFKENQIVILDELSKETKAIAFLHFHPSITKKVIVSCIEIDNENYEILEYDYAIGFNLTKKAWYLQMKFLNTLELKINL